MTREERELRRNEAARLMGLGLTRVQILDCEAIHLALDDNPADRDTRRVLADWYEENGQDMMSDGLR